MFLRWLRSAANIRTYIIGLTLITTLPLAIYAVIVVGELSKNRHQELQRSANSEAEGIARLVARQLHDMSVSLSLLATAPELEQRNFKGFHERAQDALAGSGWFLLLVDEDAQQILNTRVPYGTKLGRTGNMPAWKQAGDRQQQVISNVFYGKTGKEWVYNLLLPVPEKSQTRPQLTLILTQSVKDLAQSIGSPKLPPQWRYALVDGAGKVAASSDGTPAGGAFPVELLQELESRKRSGSALTNPAVMMGYAKVPATSWQALVWGPVATATSDTTRTLFSIVIAGIAFFCLSLLSGYLFSRTLRRAIRELAAKSRDVGCGEIVSPSYTGIKEMDDVSIVLSEASFDRNQSQEKVQLALQELSHRAKNVIHIAQSLIRQTARNSADIDEFVMTITARMSAFAKTIDLLTASEWGNPSFRDLVYSQLDVFIEVTKRVELEGEDFRLVSSSVKELGMILHELGTNAVKYGALSLPEGKLGIRWFQEIDGNRHRLRLVWEEEGGPQVQETRRYGFGTSLVDGMAASLRGAATCEFRSQGVRWELVFPTEAIVSSIPHQFGGSDGDGGERKTLLPSSETA